MDEEARSVVLLSGPVGAGKTTISTELVATAGGGIVVIEGDTFWSFIARRHKSRAQQDFRAVMRSMVAAAAPFARSGYETYVDFTIPPWYLPTLQRIARAAHVELDYVVIRPPAFVCADRAATRAEGAIPDYEKYMDLYDDFDAAEAYIVEDDGMDPRITAATIRSELATGRLRLPPLAADDRP